MVYCMYNPGSQISYDGSLPVGIHQAFTTQNIANIVVTEVSPRTPGAAVAPVATAPWGRLSVFRRSTPGTLPLVQIMAATNNVRRAIQKGNQYRIDYNLVGPTGAPIGRPITTVLRAVDNYRRGFAGNIWFTGIS